MISSYAINIPGDMSREKLLIYPLFLSVAYDNFLLHRLRGVVFIRAKCKFN